MGRIWHWCLGLAWAAILLGLLWPGMAQAEEITPQYLLPPQLEFEQVSAFSEGLALVRAGGKYGYLDQTGELVIPAEYDIANPFQEGKAIVAKLIESHPVEELGGESVWYVQDGSGLVYEYRVEIIDAHNNYIELEYDWRANLKMMDPRGAQFYHGVVYIPLLHSGGGASGLLFDAQGKRLLKDYDILSPYCDGLVHTGRQLVGGTLQPYRNLAGQVVLDAAQAADHVDFSGAFHDGLAPAAVIDMDNPVDLRWGFIDRQGAFVISPQYEDYWQDQPLAAASIFHEGIACVQNRQGLWGGIDKSGAAVVPFRFTESFQFAGGYARVTLGDQYGFIDQSGEIVIPCRYDNAALNFAEGLAWVENNGWFSYIDTSGTLTYPFMFEEATQFSGGLALVRAEGQYGILRRPADLFQPSAWAAGEIEAAGQADLIPAALSAVSYQANINRLQFAELVITLLEQALAGDLPAAPADTFVDTQAMAVLQAYAAGIVTGVSTDRYAPQEAVSREQIATMLYRAILYLEAARQAPLWPVEEAAEEPLPEDAAPEPAEPLMGYRDRGQVSAYAVEALDALTRHEIIKGINATTLAPKQTTSVEQAILLIYRVYGLL